MGKHSIGDDPGSRVLPIQFTSIDERRVDTWGVDWGLLGHSGELLTLPHCYRDPQNVAACEKALELLGGDEWLYQRTGIQLMPINTVFQIYARYLAEPKLFSAAKQIVFTPDLFHFWLSGIATVERTIASTSSLLNAKTGDWDLEVLNKLGIPTHLFGDISDPGSVLGSVRDEIAAVTKIGDNVKVVLPASHDTGCAVAAVPASGDSWLYLSSGTWSLLGAELDQPNSSSASFQAGFTNELGFNSTTRYLKNITGLWLIQELRREHQLETGEDLDYETLTKLASEATPSQTKIDPNRPEFALASDMKKKIRDYARSTDQPVPESIGEFVRCCLEGLAVCYQQTVDRLQQNLSREFSDLYIVGGGVKNNLLNDLVASETKMNVHAGPIEATAIGNILIQAKGLDNSITSATSSAEFRSS